MLAAVPILPLARWVPGSPCGYYFECRRNYSTAAVNSSAAGCPADAAQQLQRVHQTARSACASLGSNETGRPSVGAEIRRHGRDADAVLASGGWCLTAGQPNVHLNRSQSYYLPKHHGVADGIVVAVLARLLLRRAADGGPRFWSVSDFGAGVGQYGHALLSFDDYPYTGYDGAGNAEEVSGGFLRFVDFTLQLCLPRTDWVLSLEVGEHVPHEQEASYVRNLHRHNCRGIILSWAKPRQSGHAHINNHRKEYVISLFEELGYVHVKNLTSALRSGQLGAQRYEVPDWHKFMMLRYTLFAFRRITPLEAEGCTSASSVGDWSASFVE